MPAAIAKALMGEMPEPDRAGAFEVLYNPMIYVGAGVLIGMTLIDTIRESVRAKQLDAMLEHKLTETIDELQQLRDERAERLAIASSS